MEVLGKLKTGSLRAGGIYSGGTVISELWGSDNSNILESYATVDRPVHFSGLVIIDLDLGYPIISLDNQWINFTGQIV